MLGTPATVSTTGAPLGVKWTAAYGVTRIVVTAPQRVEIRHVRPAALAVPPTAFGLPHTALRLLAACERGVQALVSGGQAAVTVAAPRVRVWLQVEEDRCVNNWVLRPGPVRFTVPAVQHVKTRWVVRFVLRTTRSSAAWASPLALLSRL